MAIVNKYKHLTEQQLDLIRELEKDPHFKIIKENKNYVLYFKDNLVRVLNTPTVDKLLKAGFITNTSNGHQTFKLAK